MISPEFINSRTCHIINGAIAVIFTALLIMALSLGLMTRCSSESPTRNANIERMIPISYVQQSFTEITGCFFIEKTAFGKTTAHLIATFNYTPTKDRRAIFFWFADNCRVCSINWNLNDSSGSDCTNRMVAFSYDEGTCITTVDCWNESMPGTTGETYTGTIDADVDITGYDPDKLTTLALGIQENAGAETIELA